MKTLLFNARFAPAVRSGIKLQSIRSESNLRAGDHCEFREEMFPQLPLRKGVTITAVRPIRIAVDYPDPVIIWNKPVPSAERFAIADGFPNLLALLAWINLTYGLPFRGVLIEWEPLPACIQCGNADAPHTIRPNRYLYCSDCYQSAISLP